MATALILLLLSAYATAQKPASQLIFHLNTPISETGGDFANYYKNPIGISITGEKFITQNLAISTSIRYDNFKYIPTNKRTGDYIQCKAGLVFENLFEKLLKKISKSKMTAYAGGDLGIVFKTNNYLRQGRQSFAYSLFYGIKKDISKKSFLDFSFQWVFINETTDNLGAWIDVKIGWGIYLGK